jgi:large subunit ribosomal protein L21
MFAVVKTGGKQYRVAKDDKILVESIKAEEGATVSLDEVMMIGENGSVTVGTPLVKDAVVSAEVVSQTRGPKIIIFRRKRRKNHRRTQGHRQDLTLLRITGISLDGKPKAAKKAAAKSDDAAPKAAKKTAAKKIAAKKAAPKAAAKKAAKKAAAKGE